MPILQWPDTLIIKTVDTINNVFNITSESRSKKVISRTLSGQRFDLNIRVDVTPWNVKKASGFLFAMQNDDYYVEYSDVDWTGDALNTEVDGSFDQGVTDVAFNFIGDLEIGDWCNFAAHSKLYKIINIVGNTVTLNTPLQSNVSHTEAVELENPKIRLELAPDLKSSATFSSKLHRELSSINLRFVEVLI